MKSSSSSCSNFIGDVLSSFLGEVREVVPEGVTVHVQRLSAVHLNITLTAEKIVELHQTTYDDPQAYLQWIPDSKESHSQVEFFGFQCAEFALPVRAADCDLKFNFFSRSGYKRPHSVFPLFVINSNSSQCLLLAPLDNFHEQVLAVNTLGNKELRWGWSGDLTRIPSDFRTTTSVYVGHSPRDLLCIWGAHIRSLAGKSAQLSMRGRYSGVSISKLSMWTDNGASYWYRTEEGLDLPTTLEKTMQHLDNDEIPVASVELDSWFYEHEISRQISHISYPNVVPSSGLMLWEPRKDVLKLGGVTGLRKLLGRRPLILHGRHISARSPYVTDNIAWWVDEGQAHPKDERLWKRWMGQAADWGATAYEQDWLVEIWQGVRQLREVPGRIAHWQNALDRAATYYGIDLIWCMATPADFAEAVSLENVIAIRTSDDYRYAPDASNLWRWHLTVNCLAYALGLWPFKDVFMSHTNSREKVDIEGDPNCELEAMLASLSGGPVGIGDRLGRTNKDIVMRTCRKDGVLIKPDVPLCALDQSLINPNGLLWADTYSGSWRYIVAINATSKLETVSDHENLSEGILSEEIALGNSSPVLVYDWRREKAEITSCLRVRLEPHDWAFWVVCPIHVTNKNTELRLMYAMVGDTSVYATMGDRRIRVNERDDCVSFDVVGEPGEKVTITYWESGTGLNSVNVEVGAAAWSPVLNLPCNE